MRVLSDISNIYVKCRCSIIVVAAYDEQTIYTVS